MVNRNKKKSDSAVLTLDAIEGSVDVVRVDGASYDLIGTNALGLKTRARVARLAKRIEDLEGLAEDAITETEEQEYQTRLRELAGIALPSAPSRALDRLGTGQLADLAVAFFVRAAMRSPRMGLLRTMSPTGATSSPSSKPSTAATP